MHHGHFVTGATLAISLFGRLEQDEVLLHKTDISTRVIMN